MTYSKRRREFLKRGLALGGVLLVPRPGLPYLWGEGRSRVAVVKSGELSGGEELDDKLAEEMLGRAIDAILNGGWQKLFSAGQVVVLKLNCIAGAEFSPRPALVKAIISGLKSAGVRENDIILWDRYGRELEKAGFQLNEDSSGVRCLGTDSKLAGYERKLTISGEIGSRYSRILTRLADKVINVPVLKNHDVAGVSLAMKNHMGSIHNPSKYHGSNCSPYVADICAAPVVREKNVLNICDGTTAQCHNGPGYKPRWAWRYGGILVSEDMLALDRVGMDIINARRSALELPPVQVNYLAAGEERGLGVAELERIDKIEISV